MFGMAAAIFLVVVAIMLLGIMHKPSAQEEEKEHAFGTPLIWIGGIIVPILVLGVVLGFSVHGMAAFGDPPAGKPLTIEVIGHQWWWEVRYPQSGVVTANEIHIPTGQTVTFKLTSADVIHSFWVPELNGKMQTIPGQTNTLYMETNKAGRYRGECAVYCGLQHANMAFYVVAEPPATFNTWLAGQVKTPKTPTDPTLIRGQQVFLGSACVYCHTVAGTNASGKVGPDLSHLASRQTIAAGALPNTPGALGGWIEDPQTVKPGNLMPPENFSGPDLQALIAYLESLK